MDKVSLRGRNERSREQVPKAAQVVHKPFVSVKMDPFHHNYTLTGLVSHIQTNLAALIKAKQDPQQNALLAQQSELDTLAKIQEEVTVLQNIIIYNLDRLLANLHLQPPQPTPQPSTNHSDSPDRSFCGNHFDHSPAIVEEISSALLSRHHLQLKTHSPALSDSFSLSEPCNLKIEVDHSKSFYSLQEAEGRIKCEDISAFQQNDPSPKEMIKIQKEEGQYLEEAFELIYPEGEESMGNGVWMKCKKRRPTFSPIIERTAEQEETVKKKWGVKDVTTPSEYPSVRNKLFSFRDSRPRRVYHKRYNYLDQIRQHRS